ncbi:MAG TPA: metallophosphoesterase [Tepidisphaeraceae bacterium]|nr:metallophosphoesterase [Tepidisphaeraceae bacterium]
MEHQISAVIRPGRPQPWIHFGGPSEYQWNCVDLPIANLPRELIGLRILHLTDLHFGPGWLRGLNKVIRDVNAANADLLLMTGDFVDNKCNAGPALRFARRFFSQLHSRLGNYAIVGNHDQDLLYRFARHAAAKGWIVPEPWPKRSKNGTILHSLPPIPPKLPNLNLFGHHLLDDQALRIEFNGATIELIGIRGASRDDLDHEFLNSVPAKQAESVRIILSHQPDNVLRLESLKADIILSGHTHGGQICLPGGRALLTHDSLPKRFASGIHRIGSTWLVVSRGLGYTKIPLRLFCSPEIVEIKLTRAESN